MKIKLCRSGTKKRGLPLALLLSCTAFPASAEESSLAFDHYKAMNKAIELTFVQVFKERVDNWNIVAVLGKCKNKGLAKAVADKAPPLKDQIGDAMQGVFVAEKSLYSLTRDDFYMIHAAVANTVMGYKTGLTRGLDFAFAVKGAEDALCGAAVKKADEYLTK